jgi:hypothetical protein
MCRAFPGSEYYEASAPPVATSRQRAFPTVESGGPDSRATTNGSHVHHMPIDEPGAQLLARQSRHTYAAGLQCGLHDRRKL